MSNYRKAAIADIASAVIMIAWFFLPLGMGSIPKTGGIAPMFHPFNTPILLGLYPGMGAARIFAFVVYLVPAFAVFRIAALFLGKYFGPAAPNDSILTSGLRIGITAIMIFVALIPPLRFADTPAWFAALHPAAWAAILVAIALNILSVITLILILNYRSPIYREYRQFRRDHKGTNSASILEIFFRIRAKLFFAFLGIISTILLSLSLLLLSNYRASILEAVGDGAKSQVEQASTTYRVNLGDSIALFEYFNRQVEQNRSAKFSYNDLTIYTNRKQEFYLDDKTAHSQEMKAEFSTLSPGIQYPYIQSIAGSAADSWVTSTTASGGVFEISNPKVRTISYISPIVKVDTIRNGDEKTKRGRLLGFSVMTFNIDTIMKPYFRTRSMVFVLTLFFLYIAIILTYIIGNYIVNPLLFLRMNVRKISDILTTMMRGQARVTSSTLVYIDCVQSHDEIKALSTEINDMVTVIRGIVPYISASTLKQAEKGVASTTRKELTFLFTDIRGFTTLCEGMNPEEVVGVLNRYLDLETEIILNNHGDVDKFVGDEMMAFFEGPLKEENACRAAMQIRHAMMEEKERREKEGLPVVAIGIGINTGNVVFGSVGARDRMDFTSIGDTVNLAARLEGANKAYGSKSIITEAVYEKVKDTFLCRELDFIAVKGKNEPVRIFEILQESLNAQPKLIDIKESFEKGLAAYRARKWKEARDSFKKAADLYQDAPAQVYIERVDHFMQNQPPADWDGVFRMTVK